jgi:hypothetical protein
MCCCVPHTLVHYYLAWFHCSGIHRFGGPDWLIIGPMWYLAGFWLDVWLNASVLGVKWLTPAVVLLQPACVAVLKAYVCNEHVGVCQLVSAYVRYCHLRQLV